MSDDNGKVPDLTGNHREVGYCKPPVDTRFKPGNKAAVGRKGGLRLWRRIEKMLMERVEKGPHAGKRYADLFAKAFVKECLEGNIQHMKELLAHDSGQPSDDGRLVVEFVLVDGRAANEGPSPN